MHINSEAFVNKVKALYIQNPCRVSDIAFWKVAQLCRESETYTVHQQGHTYLYALDNQRLVFYWSDDRQHFLLTPQEIATLEFMVLHVDFYRRIADGLEGYQIRESHPLLYDVTSSPSVVRSDEFFIADFDFTQAQELAVAAEMLNRCYGTQHHSAAEVAGWRQLPVFDKSLWLWVKSRRRKAPVGLGISTYQACIRECYLDWIQILPAYQGQGLGRMLVNETLRRARSKSDIIRVTGMADDFYRKCGFVETESWRIISK